MAVRFSLKGSNYRGGCLSQAACLDKFGCPTDRNPDFIIRRHDTKPPLKVAVSDCEGPFDFRGLVIEVNMWALAKLKHDINETDEYFALADGIGFEQIMVGDIIVMDRVRMPEYMLVDGFDEKNKLVHVVRGYQGTTPSSWKKGTTLRIFRIMNAPAEAEMVFEDIKDVDGTVEKDVLTESYLVYEWKPEDTCLPGCYWLEFKVLKMIETVYFLPGGYWTGPVHMHTDGYFYTGTVHTDASVILSYDQIEKKYLLPDSVWTGPVHPESQGYHTGSLHNDGSVPLSLTGVPSGDDQGYDDSDILTMYDVSIVPSFTDPSLTPDSFGCILGQGVEWVRRFPLTGEGFLIKIENTFTREF